MDGFIFISGSHVYGFQLFNGKDTKPVTSTFPPSPKPSPLHSMKKSPKPSLSEWSGQNRTAVSMAVSMKKVDSEERIMIWIMVLMIVFIYRFDFK